MGRSAGTVVMAHGHGCSPGQPPLISQWDRSETAGGSCAVGQLGGGRQGWLLTPAERWWLGYPGHPRPLGSALHALDRELMARTESARGLPLPPQYLGPGAASHRHPHLHHWTLGGLGAGRHTSGPAGGGGCSPGPGPVPFWCPGTSARGAAAPCRAGRGRCRATAAASPAPRCTCGHRALSLDPPGPAAGAHGPAARCQEGLHTQALAEVLLCPFCGGAC